MSAGLRLQGAAAWVRDDRWILNSRTRLFNEPVFKFAYHPPTRRLWLGHGTQNHKTILKVRGRVTLDGFVRGIYFRERRTIYLRGHEREDWLRRTAEALRRSGLPKNQRVVWGPEAARELAPLLVGL